MHKSTFIDCEKNVGVHSIYAFVCVWFEFGTTGVERERISSGIVAFLSTGVERERFGLCLIFCNGIDHEDGIHCFS